MLTLLFQTDVVKCYFYFFRQGSVDVEYLVWFSEPVTKAEQDDMECAVYDSLAENNGQMGDRQARASSRMGEQNLCINVGLTYINIDEFWC